MLRYSILAAFSLALPASLAAQMTLGEAIGRADLHSYSNRVAEAGADAQAGQALMANRGILPTLRAEVGLVRTTDPIGAFGTTLRQRSVTPADFDPARLNFPDAINNQSAGLVLEQPVFNADAWTARTAARAASQAARSAHEWTRNTTRVDVVRAYFGVTLSAEQSNTLVAAEKAAEAHVARARALADTGLVTRSDVLLAEVRAGEIRAQRLAAVADEAHASRSLAVLLGEPARALTLPAQLPDAHSIRSLVEADTSKRESRPRADVSAATLARDAARADAWRARASLLPRVNGFARYDWNDRNSLFANERNWTVGVSASWSPFSGGSELADIRRTSGHAAAADAQLEAATAQAELAVEQTRAQLQVALLKLSIAESSVAQAVEASRIVARKYDGGLATISDLLEASALETRSRLGLSYARYHLIVTAAERRQALGDDPSFLVALDRSVDAPNSDRPARETP